MIDHVENRTAIAKSHLGFHRMNVDVDLFGPHVDEEQRRRMTSARNKRLVGLLDGANQHSIAHRAAVDECENHPAGGERFLARRGQTLRANSGTIEIERKHFGCDLRTEHLPESLEHRVGTRQIEDDSPVSGQTERDVVIGERDALERFCYSALLGRERLQELESRGSVEEKFADLYSRAGRHRAGAGILYIAGFG